MKHRKLNTALLLTSLILSACGEEDPGSAGSLPTLDSGPTLTLESPKKFHFTWSEGEIPVTHYRLLENPDGKVGFSDVSGAIPAGTESFTLEVALHKRANAQYILERCNEVGCKDSQTTLVTGNLTEAVGNIPLPIDEFGTTLALSGDEQTLAVSDVKSKIFLFTATETGGWELQQTLNFVSDTDNEAQLAISLSEDGSRLAVGNALDNSAEGGIFAPDQHGNPVNDGDNFSRGAVTLFHRTGNTWTEEAYIKASNLAEGDKFGTSVSLSRDGSQLAVGAPGESSNGRDVTNNPEEFPNTAPAEEEKSLSSGAVYVYRLAENNQWEQEAYIKAVNPGEIDNFGSTVSISGDGDQLVVGAPRESSDVKGVLNSFDDDFDNTGARDSGAVYVYRRDGTAWITEAFIKAINTHADDFFGTTLSLSDDGTLLAIGASNEDTEANSVYLPGEVANLNHGESTSSGAVYLYRRTGTTWASEAFIKASNSETLDRFGKKLTLSADGQHLAVVSNDESDATGVHASTEGVDNNNGKDEIPSGAVYFFSFDGTGWRQTAFVKTLKTDTDADTDTEIITNIGLSHNGDQLMIIYSQVFLGTNGLYIY